LPAVKKRSNNKRRGRGEKKRKGEDSKRLQEGTEIHLKRDRGMEELSRSQKLYFKSAKRKGEKGVYWGEVKRFNQRYIREEGSGDLYKRLS